MIEVVLSCEHGGNEIPEVWRGRWRGTPELLASHRGLDIGALDLARDCARAFGVPLLAQTVTRLLIDLNRDLDSKTLFTGEAFALEAEDRRTLVERYWHPHREALRAAITRPLAAGREVQLLSVHSFTPIWDGKTRDVDLGLLIDPSRARDRDLAHRVTERLAGSMPELRVAANRPYSGLEEGVDTSLRDEFRDAAFGVMTLEVNQRFAQDPGKDWDDLRAVLVAAFRDELAPLT